MSQSDSKKSQDEKALTARNPRELRSIDSKIELDVTGLPEEQVTAIVAKAAEKRLETIDREARIATDVVALSNTLQILGDGTAELAEKGVNVTITNTVDNTLGRTEVIMGTSDAAKQGKLTRTQKGLGDQTLIWMGFALAVLVVIVVLIIAVSK